MKELETKGFQTDSQSWNSSETKGGLGFAHETKQANSSNDIAEI